MEMCDVLIRYNPLYLIVDIFPILLYSMFTLFMQTNELFLFIAVMTLVVIFTGDDDVVY